MTDGLSGFEKSSEKVGRVKIRSVICIVPFQLDKTVYFRWNFAVCSLIPKSAAVNSLWTGIRNE
jgi:hypothetical protein